MEQKFENIKLKFLLTDDSCGYRAIFLGVKYHDLGVANSCNDEWKSLIKSETQQEMGGRRLCNEVHSFLINKRQELQPQQQPEIIDLNETTEQRLARELRERQQQYDRSFRAYRLEIGEELPSEEEEDEYLFNNIDFDFETPMDIPILQIFQKFFGNRFQIDAINYRNGDQLFVGPDAERQIYLLFSPGGRDGRGHWDLIKEMTSYRRTAYYCVKCNKGYKLPQFHMCKNGCKLCRHHTSCVADESSQDCSDCNKTFANIECYERHIENKVCKYIKVCELCEAHYTK